jgi:hypothetical protein
VYAQFAPYESSFVGGMQVITADLTGDGIDEIITAPGRSRAAQIRVFSQDGTPLTQYWTMAYPKSYVGGVSAAVGDVNGDGRNDLVTIPSYGPANVRVFLGQTGSDPIADAPWKSFLAFTSNYIGGGVVAVADVGKRVNGIFRNVQDGKAEIIVGSGGAMKAVVKVFDMVGTPTLVRAIYPFSTSAVAYNGGVSLSVARLNADSIPDLVIGAGALGGSRVEAWAWNTANATLAKLGSFTAFAGTTSTQAAVRVTTLDVTDDGIADTIVVSQGPSGKTGQIRSFNITSRSPFTVAQTSTLGYAGPYSVAGISSALPTLFGGTPLLAAASATKSSGNVTLLTKAALQPIIDEAIARWSAAGLATTLIDRMKQVHFAIADLSGQYLGVSYAGTIYLDRDAAGFGWFVDPTPAKDEEFGPGSTASKATNRIDLLTAIEHELGHIVGLSDQSRAAASLMSSQLQPSTRRIPGTREVDALFAAGVFG